MADSASIRSGASSPYVSPVLAPRTRGATADEADLPPLTLPDPGRPMIPARRGAVSGASSGPSLPFPPLPRIVDREASDGSSRNRAESPSGRPSDDMLPPIVPPDETRQGGGLNPAAMDPRFSASAAAGASGMASSSTWPAGGSVASGSGGVYAAQPGVSPVAMGGGPSGGAAAMFPRADPFSSYGVAVGASSWGPEDPRYRRRISLSDGGVAARFAPYAYHLTGRDFSHPNGAAMFLGSVGGAEAKHRLRSAPRVHSDAPRNFCCTECPARFARNHDLKRHQRGHLAVRPFPCPFCGKSFSRKDALKRHMMVKGCGVGGTDGKKTVKSEGPGGSRTGDESSEEDTTTSSDAVGRGRSESALSTGTAKEQRRMALTGGEGEMPPLSVGPPPPPPYQQANSMSPQLSAHQPPLPNPHASGAPLPNPHASQPAYSGYDTNSYTPRSQASLPPHAQAFAARVKPGSVAPNPAGGAAAAASTNHGSGAAHLPSNPYVAGSAGAAYSIGGAASAAAAAASTSSRLFALAQEHAAPVIRHHRNSLDISALLSS